LHTEIAGSLRQIKPVAASQNDVVFLKGVPSMKVFRADLKAANIPFLDDRGYRVDFHALRTSFITRLQRLGVSPREAMELARHSDMRLTMKTYTDTAQLPLVATVAQLPSFGLTESAGSQGTQLRTQTSGNGSQSESLAVTQNGAAKTTEVVVNQGDSHGESLAVTVGHEGSEWRRGGDSNPRYD
jgi:hypothetical protein